MQRGADGPRGKSLPVDAETALAADPVLDALRCLNIENAISPELPCLNAASRRGDERSRNSRASLDEQIGNAGGVPIDVVSRWGSMPGRNAPISVRRYRVASRCIQARQQHFDVFAMNCGPCSVSIKQDADAMGVDASANNRARLVGEACTA